MSLLACLGHASRRRPMVHIDQDDAVWVCTTSSGSCPTAVGDRETSAV